MERIIYKLSKAIYSAIVGTEVQSGFIPHVLRDLVDLETRPVCLTEMAYDWCAVIYENRRSLNGWEGLLLTCLEIGFRHLDPRSLSIAPTLTPTEHRLEMVDVIFKSQNSDAIADLLCSWALDDDFPYIPLDTYAERLVCLHNLVPFSSRLRRLVILSVGLVGYEGFEGVGMERFVGLLNHLRVAAEDMDDGRDWARLLLGTIKSFEGTQQLSYWYWELLVELAISCPWLPYEATPYNRETTRSLTEAQEWSKLECWIATVWMLRPPEAGGITEEDLSSSMLLLFRQRPGAFQKLEQWMERWMERCSQINDESIPESFQRICKQAREAAQRDTP